MAKGRRKSTPVGYKHDNSRRIVNKRRKLEKHLKKHPNCGDARKALTELNS